jgi:hypothetical protein
LHIARLLALVAFGLLLSSQAGAATIDFDTDSAGNPILHGDVITTQYLADDVRISAVNPNRSHDLAMAFDSDASGTRDSDLEYAWAGGNLAGTRLGGLLILAEDPVIPDDEGSRPAGQLIFELLGDPAQSIGFDLVDVESAIAEPGGIDLYLGGALQASYSFAAFTDPSSDLYDPTVVFGDRFANRIAPINLSALGLRFDEAVFRLGGSGAVDNVVVEVQPLTEPSAMVLLALALTGGALTRRRQS